MASGSKPPEELDGHARSGMPLGPYPGQRRGRGKVAQVVADGDGPRPGLVDDPGPRGGQGVRRGLGGPVEETVGTSRGGDGAAVVRPGGRVVEALRDPAA